jgi:hypothetical protein
MGELRLVATCSHDSADLNFPVDEVFEVPDSFNGKQSRHLLFPLDLTGDSVVRSSRAGWRLASST